MCRLGVITIINSCIPILTWIILGIITEDKTLINIFSLTYSVQFLPHLLASAFVIGNIIGKEKNTINKDSVFSGIIASNIVGLVMIIVSIVNIEYIMQFMGVTDIRYKNWLIYSLWLMFFTLALTETLNLLYFEGKDKEANKISLIFNFIYCLGISIIYKITENEMISIVIGLTLLGIFVYSILISKIEHFKFSINILEGVKYQLSPITSNTMMFIIYLFGMKKVFEYSPEFALAVSFCGLVTDTQWDMIVNAIIDVSKTEISKGRYNITHLFSASKLYTAIVASSIVLLAIGIYPLYECDIRYILIILLIEIVDMWIVKTSYVKSTWIDIEHQSRYSVYLIIATKIARLTISIALGSIYALWIAQLVSGVLNYIGYSLIYKHLMRKDTCLVVNSN